VQDIPSLKHDRDQGWEGSEFRFIMAGFDQARDQLLYSDLKGRNPFRDPARAPRALPGGWT
jgi:peptide/nickel transport system substrate-binding protein